MALKCPGLPVHYPPDKPAAHRSQHPDHPLAPPRMHPPEEERREGRVSEGWGVGWGADTCPQPGCASACLHRSSAGVWGAGAARACVAVPLPPLPPARSLLLAPTHPPPSLPAPPFPPGRARVGRAARGKRGRMGVRGVRGSRVTGRGQKWQREGLPMPHPQGLRLEPSARTQHSHPAGTHPPNHAPTHPTQAACRRRGSSRRPNSSSTRGWVGGWVQCVQYSTGRVRVVESAGSPGLRCAPCSPSLPARFMLHPHPRPPRCLAARARAGGPGGGGEGG